MYSVDANNIVRLISTGAIIPRDITKSAYRDFLYTQQYHVSPTNKLVAAVVYSSHPSR